MERDDRADLGYDCDKVVNLLSPKHPRTSTFSFNRPRKRISNRFWAISSMVAMLVVIISIAINSAVPVSAVEAVNCGLANLFDAESVRVEFTLCGKETLNDEIYVPDINGDIVGGTVYILKKDGKVYNRIDWHDRGKNSIIFKDGNYMHFKNGVKVDEHPCGELNGLLELINLNSLKGRYENLLKEAEIYMDDNYITVQRRESNILFMGKFRKDNNQLSEASVCITGPNGIDKVLLKTNAIDINVDIPDAF